MHAAWICTSTTLDFTYPAAPAERVVLNLSLFFPSHLAPHSEALGTLLPAIFCGVRYRWKQKHLKGDRGETKVPGKALVAAGPCGARGKADASGAFLSQFHCVLASYTVEPSYKRLNQKLIILKKINTNDSYFYTARVVLTYISRLGSLGLDPAVLICFHPMQPEAS